MTASAVRAAPALQSRRLPHHISARQARFPARRRQGVTSPPLGTGLRVPRLVVTGGFESYLAENDLAVRSSALSQRKLTASVVRPLPAAVVRRGSVHCQDSLSQSFAICWLRPRALLNSGPVVVRARP